MSTNWREALNALVDAAKDRTGWAVSGSVALVLHGAVLPPSDVDVIGADAVVVEVAQRLGLLVRRDTQPRRDLRVAVHATGVLAGVAVELLAGVQNREGTGRWSAPQGAGHPVIRRFEDRIVPVVGLPRLQHLAELGGNDERIREVNRLLETASPMSQCNTVLFDLDGTLVDHDAAASGAARALAVRLGHHDPDSLLPRWFALEDQHFGAYLDGRLSVAEQRRARLREFAAAAGGASMPEAQLDEAFAGYLADYEQAWIAYPDAALALRELKHLRRGVLSTATGTSSGASSKPPACSDLSMRSSPLTNSLSLNRDHGPSSAQPSGLALSPTRLSTSATATTLTPELPRERGCRACG